MTLETKKFMAKVRRMMTRWERLENCHCGHEEFVQKAINARLDLEDFIATEHEKLCREKGIK